MILKGNYLIVWTSYIVSWLWVFPELYLIFAGIIVLFYTNNPIFFFFFFWKLWFKFFHIMIWCSFMLYLTLKGWLFTFHTERACKNKYDNFLNLVLSGTLAREAALNVRCWSQNECPLREVRKILSIVGHGCIWCLCTLIHLNPLHMDSEGSLDSVHINGVAY